MTTPDEKLIKRARALAKKRNESRDESRIAKGLKALFGRRETDDERYARMLADDDCWQDVGGKNADNGLPPGW